VKHTQSVVKNLIVIKEDRLFNLQNGKLAFVTSFTYRYAAW